MNFKALIWRLLVLAAIAGSVGRIGPAWAQISVTLPAASGNLSDVLQVPITVGDLTGQNVTAFDFTITYDPDVVDITGFDLTSTLAAGYTVQANTTVPGQIVVGGFHSVALTGAGTLLNLNVELIDIGTTPLTWTAFQFNEGTPAAATTNGSATVNNRVPVAVDDAFTIDMDTQTDLDVLANDTDADGHPLTLSLSTLPTRGSAVIDDSGTPSDPSDDVISYTPNTGVTGTDSFVYTVSDGEGGSDDATVDISILTAAVVNLTLGWNMVGLPLTVTNSLYTALFPTALLNTLYSFGTSYTAQTNLLPGVGYWVRSSGAAAPSITGTRRTVQVLDMLSGWNLIAGPSCTVNGGGISDPGDILTENSLYRFSGSYVLSTTIEAGRAYWYHTESAGQVTLTCPGGKTSSEPETDPLVPDDFLRLIVRDGAGLQRILYIGGSLPDGTNRAMFDLPPLPPAGAFDARFESGGYVAESISREGIKVNFQVSEFPVRLALLDGESRSFAVVVDEDGKMKQYTLRAGEEVVISDEKASAVRLVPLEQEETPRRFFLAQNYPNPFNPATRIEYEVSEVSPVTLEVFDVLGRQVAILVDQEDQQPGRYSVPFEAVDLAGGIYFYALTAGEHYAVRKMLLIK